MAYITNLGPDFTDAPLFNLSNTVGRTGVNQPGDVYLMQILFWEAAKGSGLKYNFTSFAYNSELERALQDYKRLTNELAQRKNLPNAKVYYDGHIDPAKGSTRAFGTNRLWSICKLNYLLNARVKSSGYKGDVVDYVYSTFSSARAYIPDTRAGIGGLSNAIKALNGNFVVDMFRQMQK
jgi:hypothetical protein